MRGQRRLDQSGDTGGALGVADVGLHRPDQATPPFRAALRQHGPERAKLHRIAGARAVGITGSDAKVKVCLDEFGYDACINYRSTPDLDAALRAACPDGIDVYFDNVGGATLDAVLDQINVGARIVVCGTIGMDAPTGPRIRVPSVAVQREGGDAYVWVVNEGRVERRAVTVGAENDGNVEVLAGVNSGEELVSPVVPGLEDGGKVKLAEGNS